MGVNIGAAVEVLYSPRKALESVKDGAKMSDGIILFVLFAVLGSIIGGLLSYGVIGTIVTSNGMSMSIGSWAVSMVLDIILGVVMFLIVGFVIAKIAGAIGSKPANVERTIGLLGYTQVIPFVLGLIASLVVAVTGASIISTSSLGVAVGTGLGFLGIIFVLGLLELIWMLLVGGMAISIANEVSWGAGIAAYIVGGLIIAAILFAIVVAVVAAVGFTLMGTGMAGAGLF